MRQLALAFIFAASGSFLGAAEPDGANRSPDIQDVQVSVELDAIQLRFLVRDAQGNFVSNLKKEDFSVMENGREQTIFEVQEHEVPIDTVVMVDTSASLAFHLPRALKAGTQFFSGLSEEDAAFVLFSEKPEVALDWQQSETSLDLDVGRDHLEPHGRTALYDSVIWVARYLFQDRPGKKVIILLTDGIDTASRASFQVMMDVTRRAGVTLYPVIYTNEEMEKYRNRLLRNQPPIRPDVSRHFLEMIEVQNSFLDACLRHGGRVILSDGFQDLEKIYSDILQEMKSQYVILYQSGEDYVEQRELRLSTERIQGRVFVDVTR